MRSFRLLRADEIECRISEIAKNGQKLSLLLYKTARTDAALLDETLGMANWQNKYEVIDGKIYCYIGIKSGNEWIWKGNVGTESNMEAEKGQASDAMKRAGFVLGIGTELYSAPRVDVWTPKCSIKEVNGKFRCYDTFSVKEIEYDKNERIVKLAIQNDTLKSECFRYDAVKADPPPEAPPKATIPPPELPPIATISPSMCAECKAPLLGYIGADGKPVSVRKHIAGSMSKFGKALCLDCINKLKADED